MALVVSPPSAGALAIMRVPTTFSRHEAFSAIFDPNHCRQSLRTQSFPETRSCAASYRLRGDAQEPGWSEIGAFECSKSGRNRHARHAGFNYIWQREIGMVEGVEHLRVETT